MFSKFLFLFCSTLEDTVRLLTYYFFLYCFQLEFSQNLNGHILSINRFYAYLTISITKAAFDSNPIAIQMDSIGKNPNLNFDHSLYHVPFFALFRWKIFSRFGKDNRNATETQHKGSFNRDPRFTQ